MSAGHRDYIDKSAEVALSFNRVLKKYLEYINFCSVPSSSTVAKKQKLADDDRAKQLDRTGIFTSNEESIKEQYYWRILSPPRSCVQDLHADFAHDDIQKGWENYVKFYEEKFITPYSLIYFDMG
jgi:hypothetical protein